MREINAIFYKNEKKILTEKHKFTLTPGVEIQNGNNFRGFAPKH